MSDRPYRILFTGCRSQRTADQILTHLRAGHDVTIMNQRGYGGFEIQRMDIGSITETMEFTAADYEKLRMSPELRKKWLEGSWITT